MVTRRIHRRSSANCWEKWMKVWCGMPEEVWERENLSWKIHCKIFTAYWTGSHPSTYRLIPEIGDHEQKKWLMNCLRWRITTNSTRADSMVWFKETFLSHTNVNKEKRQYQFRYGTMFRFCHWWYHGLFKFPVEILQVYAASWCHFLLFVFIIHILLAKLVWYENCFWMWVSIMVTVLFLGGIQLLECRGSRRIHQSINDAVQAILYIINKTNME